jgi:hypothetical protein
MFTRCGICCVQVIFERRRGRLGPKISGHGKLAKVAVYFAMSGLPGSGSFQSTTGSARHLDAGQISNPFSEETQCL